MIAALLAVGACGGDDRPNGDSLSGGAGEESAEQEADDRGSVAESSVESTELADEQPVDQEPAAEPTAGSTTASTEPAADAEETDGQPITESALDPVEESIRALTIGGLIGVGYTEEEAACVFESVDLTAPNGPVESEQQFITLLRDCGMSAERILELTDPSG